MLTWSCSADNQQLPFNINLLHVNMLTWSCLRWNFNPQYQILKEENVWKTLELILILIFSQFVFGFSCWLLTVVDHVNMVMFLTVFYPFNINLIYLKMPICNILKHYLTLAFSFTLIILLESILSLFVDCWPWLTMLTWSCSADNQQLPFNVNLLHVNMLTWSCLRWNFNPQYQILKEENVCKTLELILILIFSQFVFGFSCWLLTVVDHVNMVMFLTVFYPFNINLIYLKMPICNILKHYLTLAFSFTLIILLESILSLFVDCWPWLTMLTWSCSADNQQLPFNVNLLHVNMLTWSCLRWNFNPQYQILKQENVCKTLELILILIFSQFVFGFSCWLLTVVDHVNMVMFLTVFYPFNINLIYLKMPLCNILKHYLTLAFSLTLIIVLESILSLFCWLLAMVDHVNMVMFWTTNNYPSILTFYMLTIVNMVMFKM